MNKKVRAPASLMLSLVWALAACSLQSEEVFAAPVDDQAIISLPLEVRETNGSPFFENIPAEKSGIDFVHQWTPDPVHAHLINGAMCGGGVAIGDVDGDGLPDIYLTRPHGGCRLYKNLGSFTFEDVTSASGLDNDAWGLGATFADIDNDGDLDLYVCGYACPNRLYINDGRGRFTEQAAAYGLDFSGASVMMAFADYDNDGDLDAYLLTNRLDPPEELRGKGRAAKINGQWHVPAEYREYSDVLVKPDGQPLPIQAAQFDHLYRNDNGKFVDVSASAGIDGNHFGLSATWWDYDLDGYLDLYVANDFYGPDHLYHNNGDGTFTDVAKEAFPHTPWFSMGSAAGDINNDGRPDFIASDMSGRNHYRQKMAMGEMGENAWFLASAEPRQYMRNAVYLNTGMPRFMEAAYLTGLASSDWTWATKFADLDNDGWLDLFISNGMTRDWFNSDLRNESLALGGFRDPRGWDFWMKQPPLREANLAFRNQGTLKFEEVGALWGLDRKAVSFGAAFGDLDLDGDLDLVVNNFGEAPDIYANRSSGNRVQIRLEGKRSNRFGLGARVRLTTKSGEQWRELSLAGGFMSSDEPIIHFGLGSETLIETLTIRWPLGAVQTFESLPANHRYIIRESETDTSPAAWPERPGPRLFAKVKFEAIKHAETPFDDFAKQPLLPNQLSQLGPALASGDIDNDGHIDFFIGGAAGQAGVIYRNHGNGRFTQQMLPSDAASEDLAAVFFDVDGDGDQDLLVVSGGVEHSVGDAAYRDRLYRNDGNGVFVRDENALPDLRDSGSCVAVSDFDRDGDIDVFIGSRVIPGRYPLPPEHRLLLNHQGRFSLSEISITAGLVTGALWADINGDAWDELIVTQEWGPVKQWHNVEGILKESTKADGFAALSGWWNAIASGDVDGDGDVDLVAGNFGLNTKYHQPAHLYAIDHESEDMRLIEAEFEGDQLFPMRGKSCSTNAIPSLTERFHTFDAFARATLPEIYTSQSLGEAMRFEATTLESGVFFNDGSGNFNFRPLPRLAQIAPVLDIALADFDDDGTLDLVLAQNFHGPQPETGRMGGGVSLFLRGDGAGGFDPVWPDVSGVLVPGQASSVVAPDVDGDGLPDLLFGVNDSVPLLFLNRSNHGAPRGR